jgi:hypothetical protein
MLVVKAQGDDVTVNLRVLVNCMEKDVNQIYKQRTESEIKRRRLLNRQLDRRASGRLAAMPT